MAEGGPFISDGKCKVCEARPSANATLWCASCHKPWHVKCLSEVKSSAAGFMCPDCSAGDPPAPPLGSGKKKDITTICEIKVDSALWEARAKIPWEALLGRVEEPSWSKLDQYHEIDRALLSNSIRCSHCTQAWKSNNKRKRGQDVSCILSRNGRLPSPSTGRPYGFARKPIIKYRRNLK